MGSDPSSAAAVWRLDESGALRALGDDAIRAVHAERPVLEEGFGLDGVAPAPVVVAWSGTPGAGPAERFERDPRAWLPGAAAALDVALDRLAPRLETEERRLWLRPHARHVLGDAHRVRSFLDGRNDGRLIGLLLDPASMVESGMEAEGLGHVERALESLAGRSAAVVAANVRRSGADALEPAPLDEGLLDARELAALVRGLVPAGVPLVLVGGDPDRQLELLSG